VLEAIGAAAPEELATLVVAFALVLVSTTLWKTTLAKGSVRPLEVLRTIASELLAGNNADATLSVFAATSGAGEALGLEPATTGAVKLGAELALATGAEEAAALAEGLGDALLLGLDVSPPQPVTNSAKNPKVSKEERELGDT
jgi:hypothetical protein